MNTAVATKAPKTEFDFVITKADIALFQKRLVLEINKDIIEHTLRTQEIPRKNNPAWDRLKKQDVHRVGDVGFVKLREVISESESPQSYFYGIYSPVRIQTVFPTAFSEGVWIIGNLKCVPAANAVAWFKAFFESGRSDIELRVRVIGVDHYQKLAYVVPLALNLETAEAEWKQEEQIRIKEKEFVRQSMFSNDPTYLPYRSLAIYERYIQLQVLKKNNYSRHLKLVKYDTRSNTAIIVNGQLENHHQGYLKLHHVTGANKVMNNIKEAEHLPNGIDDLIVNYVSEVKT